MARTSWFDDKAEHPLIHEKIEKLESFTSALADGHVSKQELGGQEQRLVAAMKALEPDLSDALHAQGHDGSRGAVRLQRDAPPARAPGGADPARLQRHVIARPAGGRAVLPSPAEHSAGNISMISLR